MFSNDYRNTSSKDGRLYGAPRQSKTTHRPTKAISSSNTISFSNALSSLISASSSNSQTQQAALPPTTSGRARPSHSNKSDIFTSHNRNTKKRAAADLAGNSDAVTIGRDAADNALDDASWRRTKRKMEEKARLYAAMKRGDVDDESEKHMVDFDRKWVETVESQDNDDDDSAASEEELVDYTDEFGRSRRGTRGDAAREERRRRAGRELDESDRFTARPVQPANIIYGDTVQAAAFNPGEPVAAQMDALAAKRDRELTPPDAVHYDAKWEVRSKGTGFFQFSQEEEARKAEMASLERERAETERIRKKREERREGKRREVEERRRVILERRDKVQVDRFLDDLGCEMSGNADGETVEEGRM